MASRKRTAMEIKREQKQRRLSRQMSKPSESSHSSSSLSRIAPRAPSAASGSARSSSFAPVSAASASSSSSTSSSSSSSVADLVRSSSCPPPSASSSDDPYSYLGHRMASSGGLTKPLPFAKFRPEKFSVIDSSDKLFNASSEAQSSKAARDSGAADFLSPSSNFHRTANNNHAGRKTALHKTGDFFSPSSVNMPQSSVVEAAPGSSDSGGSSSRSTSRSGSRASRSGLGSSKHSSFDAIMQLDELLQEEEEDFPDDGMQNIYNRVFGAGRTAMAPSSAAPTPGGGAELPGVALSDAKLTSAELHKIGPNGGIQWWTTYDRVPVDWNIKRMARVKSSLPLDWLKSLGEVKKCEGLAAHGVGSLGNSSRFDASWADVVPKEGEIKDAMLGSGAGFKLNGIKSRERGSASGKTSAPAPRRSSRRRRGKSKSDAEAYRKSVPSPSCVPSDQEDNNPDINIDSFIGSKSASATALCSAMRYHVYPADRLPAPMLALRRQLHKLQRGNRHTTGETNESGFGFAIQHSTGRSSSSSSVSSSSSSYSAGKKSWVSQYFTSRLRTWREAFIGLWTMLKSRQCSSFYYRTKDFTVLFRHSKTKSPGGNPDEVEPGFDDAELSIRAVLSPSTKKIRSDLSAQDITFEMPLLEGRGYSAREAKELEESNRELKELADSASQQGGLSGYVRTVKSRGGELSNLSASAATLLFEGMDDVESLYDYLRSNKGPAKHHPTQLHDVPELLCDMAFPNSANKSVTMKANGSLRVTASSQLAGGQLRPLPVPSRDGPDATMMSASDADVRMASKDGMVYAVDFEGPLLPTMWPRIMSALAQCQLEHAAMGNISGFLDLRIDCIPSSNSFYHNVITHHSPKDEMNKSSAATGRKRCSSTKKSAKKGRSTSRKRRGKDADKNDESRSIIDGEMAELKNTAIVRVELSNEIPERVANATMNDGWQICIATSDTIRAKASRM